MSLCEKSKRKFTVKIYVEEYLQLCSWVLKHERIETGGDLFGLWADDRTAVIQLVLGPGKECSRTSASFYQDVEYLKEVGSYLTGSEGLCHIGEWHSHHQLGLARPSGGDESTVWNNMPTYGLDRFVIFIANIDKDHQSLYTNVGCFLFEIEKGTNRIMPVLEGQFDVMNEKSPMRSKMKTIRGNNAAEVFAERCESLNSDETLQSLNITRDKKTSRLKRVSKERGFTEPQYGGTRQGLRGKRNTKQKNDGSETQESKLVEASLAGENAHATSPYTQTNRNTAPRGEGENGQQRSETEKEVKENREAVTVTTSSAPGKMKKGRNEGGDAKQVSTHKSNEGSQQLEEKRERSEPKSSNTSQGKPKAIHPGHAKRQ